jgi:hypothetical protein
LSDSFSIQNGLKQGYALSPLLYKFSLGHVIRNVQENKLRLKLKWTYQLLAYAHDVKLGEKIDSKNKNTNFA